MTRVDGCQGEGVGQANMQLERAAIRLGVGSEDGSFAACCGWLIGDDLISEGSVDAMKSGGGGGGQDTDSQFGVWPLV